MAHVEKILLDLLQKIIDDQKYEGHDIKIKAITSGGANYTSALYLATISAPNKEDLNLFAKIAIVSDKMRIRMNADWMFSTERYVYTKLAKVYRDLEEKHGVPPKNRFKFPKFYGCNPNIGEETVVLENLVANGYGSYNRFKSIDYEYASCAVEELAKFHALSFAYQKERPEEFEKVIQILKYQTGVEDEYMWETWTKMAESALEVTKEEYRSNVVQFLKSGDAHEKFKKFNMPFDKPVLIHGDFRSSNLLFRRQDDKMEIITVDFQTVHAGSPVCDLIYFIFMGSDEEFRRNHYEDILELYYSELSQALRTLDIDINDIYSKEKYKSDVKEMLPYALLIGVAILPVVTVESERAPRVDGDADIGDFVFKPNNLFAERFSGIVNDCVAWGAI